MSEPSRILMRIWFLLFLLGLFVRLGVSPISAQDNNWRPGTIVGKCATLLTYAELGGDAAKGITSEGDTFWITAKGSSTYLDSTPDNSIVTYWWRILPQTDTTGRYGGAVWVRESEAVRCFTVLQTPVPKATVAAGQKNIWGIGQSVTLCQGIDLRDDPETPSYTYRNIPFEVSRDSFATVLEGPSSANNEMWWRVAGTSYFGWVSPKQVEDKPNCLESAQTLVVVTPTINLVRPTNTPLGGTIATQNDIKELDAAGVLVIVGMVALIVIAVSAFMFLANLEDMGVFDKSPARGYKRSRVFTNSISRGAHTVRHVWKRLFSMKEYQLPRGRLIVDKVVPVEGTNGILSEIHTHIDTEQPESTELRDAILAAKYDPLSRAIIEDMVKRLDRQKPTQKKR